MALSLAVLAIVFIEKAQRRIPVNYAQKSNKVVVFYCTAKSHLPLKINMAGVIPAILQAHCYYFPASLGQWVGSADPNAGIVQT